MESIFDWLHSICPLSAGLEAYLLRALKYRKLKRKEFLLKAGMVDRYIFVIRSGLLRAFYENGETEVSSCFMKEGDVIVSVESFYDQTKSYESIQALEDSELYYIGFQELEFIYREFAEFNVTGRLLAIRYLKLSTRQLYGIRMRSAKERYDWLLRNCPDLVRRVPGKYLASYLDITWDTLNRVRRRAVKARIAEKSF